ncbi:hypothetical protein NE573_24040, partial [Parabacteroides distasonis]|nr:hypothetical protein [Parabacteroides distasonis]
YNPKTPSFIKTFGISQGDGSYSRKKNIKTGLSSFLLVDSNGDLLSGRPFFKLENISSLQSLPPDFEIRLLPIMNDPGTDSIRKNLVLDTLAKTLTIDQ